MYDRYEIKGFARLLSKTETAIVFRIQELNRTPGGYFERLEISEALKRMLNLRIERLGWPDVPKS
jgi:hypothetical protein